jgi:glycosyltransferase involved in cell wall biosynthesis
MRDQILKEFPEPTRANTGWPWAKKTTRFLCSVPKGKSLPKISIVTPSYNQVMFIEETIRSVLLQEYPNFEYIVIDGGSTDGSVEIIKKYGENIDYWISKPDSGQADAINKGFARATGDILCWLNSDDMLTKDALSNVAEAWQKHGPNIIVTGGCIEFRESDRHDVHFPRFQREYDVKCELPISRMLDLSNEWIKGIFFYQPEVFFPRSAYEEVGCIDNSLFYAMDYDLWVRFALNDVKIVVLAEPLAYFRFHSLQKTGNRIPVLKETISVAEKYLKNDTKLMKQMERIKLRYSNRRFLIKEIMVDKVKGVMEWNK